MRKIQKTDLAKMMNKGVIPFLAIGIVIIATILLESTILVNTIGRSENVIRADKETKIIKAINIVEFVKKSVSQALVYSFNQATYDTSSRGGYSNLTGVRSLSCIPYWREYSEENYPDVEESLKKSTFEVFDSYRSLFNSVNVNVPKYEDMKIKRNDDESLNVKVSSPEDFRYESLAFEITDLSDYTINVKIRLLKLFDVGKEVVKKVADELESDSSYDNAVEKLKDLEDDSNSVYNSDEIEISLEPSGNLGSSSFAIRALVKLTDKSSKAIAYDFSEKTVSERNVQLKFYVLSGKEKVQAEVNECKNIVYSIEKK
jgi:hypothetical protein